jgi:predicted permease
MVQEILIGIVLIIALGFLIRKFFFKSKSNQGCDKCAKP